MSTEIVIVATCHHPELVESQAPWPDCGMQYQCSTCQKKVVIPSRTIMEPLHAQEVNRNIAGILGLAFGEQWRITALRRAKL